LLLRTKFTKQEILFLFGTSTGGFTGQLCNIGIRYAECLLYLTTVKIFLTARKFFPNLRRAFIPELIRVNSFIRVNSPAAHKAACLAGESPVAGIELLPA
jgi:hypothetical protein